MVYCQALPSRSRIGRDFAWCCRHRNDRCSEHKLSDRVYAHRSRVTGRARRTAKERRVSNRSCHYRFTPGEDGIRLVFHWSCYLGHHMYRWIGPHTRSRACISGEADGLDEADSCHKIDVPPSINFNCSLYQRKVFRTINVRIAGRTTHTGFQHEHNRNLALAHRA